MRLRTSVVAALFSEVFERNGRDTFLPTRWFSTISTALMHSSPSCVRSRNSSPDSHGRATLNIVLRLTASGGDDLLHSIRHGDRRDQKSSSSKPSFVTDVALGLRRLMPLVALTPSRVSTISVIDRVSRHWAVRTCLSCRSRRCVAADH